jgi:hypothetical protein
MSTLLVIAAWVVPAVLFAAVTWGRKSEVAIRVATGLMFPVGWICGLSLLMWRVSILTSDFLAAHRGKEMTEEEFFSVPDGPNVFAGWILLGWLPVLVGFLVTRPLRRRAIERGSELPD